MKRTILRSALALCLAALLAAQTALAAVPLFPGVTEEMTEPGFWSGMAADPDAVLSTPEEIARVNAAALTAEGSGMHDLKALASIFDGDRRLEVIRQGAQADAEYFLGWTYGSDGKKLTREDFDRIIENCIDPKAAGSMPVRFGVAVNRTLLTVFPYDGQILDDPEDLDFDYQGLVGIRVNEPIAAFTASADGKWWQVYTACCSGWVRAEDVAFCASREEWLDAWDIPPEKRLVFWGDKLYTDYSKEAPETSCRLLTMGTVLERMETPDRDALVINRLPVHNYAVYLPVRNPDGSYGKTPALLNAREKLSEDYLPLTAANLAKAALASLGDAYGWGGTLYNEDCTSLNRSIFKCFGLELPRNGNWLWALSMPKQDVTGWTTEQKKALLDTAPLGTLLDFPGHQMMYLGKVEGEYYCVSTVSSIMSPWSGKRLRTRCVQINTLDIKRGSGLTWLEAVDHVSMPWKYLPAAAADAADVAEDAWYAEGVEYCLENRLMTLDADGSFRPNETASRATAVEALWRISGAPAPGGEAQGFADVSGDASYAEAVLWAREQDVIRGTGGGQFDPEGTLTREAFAVMFFRAAAPEDQGGSMGLAGFADSADISDWAYAAMGWAVRTGLLNGKGENRLCPRDTMTRAELATILLRAASLVGPQRD